eukprot:Tbor_TRINITY_DN3375_c0_g2::TRINITY_DN3375_c0_g2_i1::g.23479::m.23479
MRKSTSMYVPNIFTLPPTCIIQPTDLANQMCRFNPQQFLFQLTNNNNPKNNTTASINQFSKFQEVQEFLKAMESDQKANIGFGTAALYSGNNAVSADNVVSSNTIGIASVSGSIPLHDRAKAFEALWRLDEILMDVIEKQLGAFEC